MSTEGGEDDLQRVLDREKQLETEDQGKGSSSDGTSNADNEDEVRETLRRRMQAYIASHSNNSGPARRNSSSNEINEPYNLTNSTYTAISNLRAKNLEAPNLYGGVSNISDSLGSFKPSGETWGAPPVARQNFGTRQNISFNFDPVTMQCKNCNGDPHRVLSGVGGTDENPMDRMIIVLADQSFPAMVGPEDGGHCIMVVRLEFGTPGELVEIFLDLARGCQIPAGSVVLLSSMSHLADVGLSAYTADLNLAATKLIRALRGGVMVLPGLVFPAAKIVNPMVVRGVIDLLTWSAEASKVSDSVQPILNESHRALRDLLAGSGTGTAPSQFGARCRLPVQLGNPEYRKWELTGPEKLPSSTGPVPSSKVLEILNMATSELAVGLGLNYTKVANLFGATGAGSKTSRDMLIIGASHASRLHTAFKSAGANSKWLETRNWRPTTTAVDALALEIQRAVSGLSQPVLVFSALDNSYFQTGCTDGSIVANRRDEAGIYHVEGDLICGPAESAKRMFAQLVPVFKKFQELDKILLVPFPRYLWAACCMDDEHATNTRVEGYQEEQLSDLDACQRLWRGLAHRQGLINFKICNTGRLLADAHLWTGDPVHPGMEGYERVVRFVIQGLDDMAAKRKLLGDSDSDLEDMAVTKKPKADTGMEAMPPPRFRPAWTSSTGHFVSPVVSRPFNTGRGRPGRRFGRGGGRRPYF
jgi:hypothetical protein